MKTYTEHDIIRFLDGEMPAGEREEFEKDFLENETLRRQVGEYRTVVEGIRDHDLLEARKQVSQFEAGRKKPIRQWLKIAAAVSILVTAGLVLIVGQDPVYDEFFSPYPNVAQSRGQAPGAFDLAMLAYTEGSYSDAASQLALLKNQNDTVTFYLAGARLFAGEPVVSEAHLRRILENQGPFRQQAEWLLVKALLDQEKNEEAIALLESIAGEPSHSYHEDAGKLRDIL